MLETWRPKGHIWRTMSWRRILILIVVLTGVITLVFDHIFAVTDVSLAWAHPTVTAIKRVSSAASAQHEPVYLSNLDCTLLNYRQVSTSTMRSGCFTETAYGLVDSDNDVVIFNGTDEGVPLSTYASGEILAPWPRALDLVQLSFINTGGTLVSLYRNPLNALQDQRNLVGQLVGKKAGSRSRCYPYRWLGASTSGEPSEHSFFEQWQLAGCRGTGRFFCAH